MPDTLTFQNFPAHVAMLSERFHNAPLQGAMAECSDVLADGIRDNFLQSQTPDGEPWPAHAPLTIKLYGPHPLLILTGLMSQSSTTEGAPGHVREIDARSVTIGTTVEYAHTHDEGGFTEEGYVIPQREFMGVSEFYLNQCSEIIADAMYGVLLAA